MTEWRSAMRWYLIQVLKLVVESIAFLVPAIIVGALLSLLFKPSGITQTFAPGAIAVVVFTVAMKENYCFLTENRYTMFSEQSTSDDEQNTLDTFSE